MRLPAAIRSAWGLLVWAFEKADIIPPLVIVSAWHYTGALSGRDPAIVAVVLGVLIDLGHYRSVKAVMHRPEELRRFAVMAVLTAMTGYYHWLWYRDLVLSVAVPVLIICLSLLGKWGGWERQALQSAQAPLKSGSIAKPSALTFTCERCGARFESKNKLAGHIGGKHGNHQ